MMFQNQWYKKIRWMSMYLMVWIFVFQKYLEQINGLFRYTDELVTVVAGLVLLKEVIISKGIRASKETWMMVCLLLAFISSGLAGSLIYQYQPIKAVAIDLVANTKFYFAIVLGYYLFRDIPYTQLKDHINVNLKVITIFIFVFLVLDQILDIYWGQVRYGFKSATMFFQHPTYLAGAAAFLIVMLTIFYEKNNLIYIYANIIIMLMTMRSKAIASALVYIILFYMITTFKKKIKITDIFLLGIICIIIAWPMIDFYFVSLGGKSARSIMLNTSFEILGDYFPIGTGLGTYASDMAREYYSPIYVKYGFMHTWELKPGSTFLIDSFWPVIIGQTGAIGTISYVGVLYILLKKCLAIFQVNKYVFVGALYTLIYMVISSTAEPIFNNSIAIPLGVALGIVFCIEKRKGI